MKLLPYVLIGSLVAIACGGKDGSSSPGGTGGMGGESGMAGAPAMGGSTSSTVQFVTEAELDVPGYPSTARVVSDLADDAAYAWELVSAPKGSSVRQDDLEGESEPEVSFVPDLGGAYVLEVTVTLDGASATKTVTITPPTYDVPFLFTAANDDDGGRRVPRIVKSGGEAVRDLGCTEEAADQTPETWNNQAYVTLTSGFFVRLFFPATVHGTARMAYNAPLDDMTSTLLLASSQTSCKGEQPVALGESAVAPWATSPRFSRTGTRLAAVRRDADGSAHLGTFGVDGASPRLIKSWQGEAALFPYHAIWLGADRIAWVEPTDTGATLLLAAPDADGAALAPETLLDCTDAEERILNGLGVAAFGDVL